MSSRNPVPLPVFRYAVYRANHDKKPVAIYLHKDGYLDVIAADLVSNHFVKRIVQPSVNEPTQV